MADTHTSNTEEHTMSEKQNAFIARLVSERWQGLGAESYGAAVAAIPLAQMATKQKSELIDRLLKLPVDPDESQPQVVVDAYRKGPNDSPGRCEACGWSVEPRHGYFYGPFDQGKRWRVHHKVGACNETPAPEPTKVEEGYYLVGEGDDAKLIQVYRTKNDRLGGKEFLGSKFQYVKGAVHLAGTGERITEEEMAALICYRLFGALPGSDELKRIAAKHGVDHGNCIFCSRDLTDERSDPVQGGAGYGPVCARRYNLPWG